MSCHYNSENTFIHTLQREALKKKCISTIAISCSSWAAFHGSVNDVPFIIPAQSSPVAHWCPTLCDPMGRSMSGLLHHWVDLFYKVFSNSSSFTLQNWECLHPYVLVSINRTLLFQEYKSLFAQEYKSCKSLYFSFQDLPEIPIKFSKENLQLKAL